MNTSGFDFLNRFTHSIAIVAMAFTASALAQESVQIDARIIANDLSAKPVPKHLLQVFTAESPEQHLKDITTSFDGKAEFSVPPGRYTLRSKNPIPFGGQSFRWTIPFDVKKGSTTLIELSNDNAEIAGESVPTSGSNSASLVFDAIQSGVVTVESENGAGSGFLVDPQGLILTNAHVTSGSRFFAVELSDDIRYPALLVAEDPTEDVAVLRIHPDLANTMTALALMPDTQEKPPVIIGQKVFAIGSPLNQKHIITEGIVSQIESGAIISDVMIDHGNSGGPLVNGDGGVVGINTFLDENRGTVVGVVRIWKAHKILDDARSRPSDVNIPSADSLPPYPKEPYPAKALEAIVLNKEFNPDDYKVLTKKFGIYFATPPAAAYLDYGLDIEASKGRTKRRDKKNIETTDTYDPVDIKGWYQYVGALKPIVSVQVFPRYKATFGSKLGVGLLAGLTGVPARGLLNYRYVGDFDSMQLKRGEMVIPLVRVSRKPIPAYIVSDEGHMKDVAYMGVGEYLPDAFNPVLGAGQQVVLEIKNEADPEKDTRVEIDQELLNRIWTDFAPVRERQE